MCDLMECGESSNFLNCWCWYCALALGYGFGVGPCMLSNSLA